MDAPLGKEILTINGNTKRMSLCFLLSAIALAAALFLSLATNIISNLWQETTIFTIGFKVCVIAFTALLTIIFGSLLIRNRIVVYENGFVSKRGFITKTVPYSNIRQIRTRTFKREFPGGRSEMIYYYDIFTSKSSLHFQGTAFQNLKPDFDYVINKVNGEKHA